MTDFRKKKKKKNALTLKIKRRCWYWIPFHPLPMFWFLSELLNREGKNLTFSTPLLWCSGMRFRFCPKIWRMQGRQWHCEGQMGSCTRGGQQPLNSKFFPGLVAVERLWVWQQSGCGCSSSWSVEPEMVWKLWCQNSNSWAGSSIR